MKPFYIGSVNIYDFQAKTGYHRWNTLQAQRGTLSTPEFNDAVNRTMLLFGFDLIQARRHVAQREHLFANSSPGRLG
jgi:hypothetical protein